VDSGNCDAPEERRNTVEATWHCTSSADEDPGTDESVCSSAARSVSLDANVTPDASASASISPTRIEYCASDTTVTVKIDVPATSNTIFNLDTEITLPQGTAFYPPSVGDDFLVTASPWENVTDPALTNDVPSGGRTYKFEHLATAVEPGTEISVEFIVSSNCFASDDNIVVKLEYDDCCGTHYTPDPASELVESGKPELEVAVIPADTSADCAADVPYTITVENTGEAVATYFRISASLGEWLSYQPSDPPILPTVTGGGVSSGPGWDDGTNPCCNDANASCPVTSSNGNVIWEVKDLEAGETWETTLTVKMNPPEGSDCDAADRQLNVTTQYGCPSVTGTWTFDENACTDEDSGTCPTYSGTAVSQQDSADLIITDMSPAISCSGGTVAGSVAVTVTNQGTGATPASGFTVRLTEAGGWSAAADHTAGAMAAGGSAVINIDLSGLSPECASCSTYSFEVTVDSATNICECDDANNTFGPVSFNNCGSVGNHVWLDADGDGVQDVGETGLSNIEVSLLGSGGSIIASAKTDISGNYLFTGVFPGTYSVSVTAGTVPAGLTSSSAPPGSILISPGDSYPDADFGYENTGGQAIIGDTVWSDANGNGTQDSGEPGIGGVLLNLISAGPDSSFGTADDVVKAVMTDDDGSYFFDNLNPDKYIVDVTDTGDVLNGYSLTGGTDPGMPVTLGAGEIYLNADFGYQNTLLSSISDTVWFDTDSSGTRDSGESGIAGVTVSLLSADGNIIATTVTSPTGSFSFSGIENGDYTIIITDTNDELSGCSGTTTDADNSQKSVTGGHSGMNFGYTRPGTVGDTVFSDADGDGVQDAGEPGISGVTVVLWQDADENGVFDSTLDSSVMNTVTGPDGKYSFTGLASGDYFISVDDAQTGLNSYAPSTTDHETGGNAAGTQIEVALASGSLLDADFGYQNNSLANISGSVWDDLNTDATDDWPDEPPIAGVTVVLRKDGNVIAETVTNAGGDFSFSGVAPGGYSITVTDDDDVLDGYTLTTSGGSLPVTVTSADITDQDFGYVRNPETGSIGDLVWNDVNGDRVRDGGEPGIGNVFVTLYQDVNDNGVIDSGDTDLGSVITDADGGYVFTGLPAGDYLVDVNGSTVLTALPGSVLTTANEPLDVALSAEEDYSIADLGYQQQGTVSGHLFEDSDGNGTQNSGEPNLAGVNVIISDCHGGTHSVTTDANGDYAVTVPVGTASVNVNKATLPAAYIQTAGSESSTVDVPAAGTVDAGSDGYQLRGQVSGHLFEDTNGNGTQDSGEPNLAGVRVVITDVRGASQTVTTNSSGDYTATVLAGNTSVNVDETSLPSGYVQTAGSDPTIVGVPVNGTGNAGNDGCQKQDVSTIGDFVWRDLNGDGVQDDLVGVTDTNGVLFGYTLTGAADPHVISLTGDQVYGDADFGYRMRTTVTLEAIQSSDDVNGGNLESADELLYTIVLRNQSDFDITGAEFTDNIPQHTRYVAGSVAAPSGSVVEKESPVIRITGITIPGSGQTTITFRVRLEAPLPAGVTEISNQGTINYDSDGDGVNDKSRQTDSNPEEPADQPNTDQVTSGPNFSRTTKEVSFKTDADGDTLVSPGDTLRYTAVIPNTGDQDAAAVFFSDPVPADVTYIPDSVKADSGTVSYNETENRVEWAGNLAAGEGVTVIFDVRINSDIPARTVISNQGTVSYDSDADGINDATEPTDSDTSETPNPVMNCSSPSWDETRAALRSMSQNLWMPFPRTQSIFRAVSVCPEVMRSSSVRIL